MVMALAPLAAWLEEHRYAAAAAELGLPQEVARLLTTKKEYLADAEYLRTLCPSLSLAQVRAVAGLCRDTPPDVYRRLCEMDHRGDAHSCEIDETFVNRLSYDFLDAPPEPAADATEAPPSSSSATAATTATTTGQH